MIWLLQSPENLTFNFCIRVILKIQRSGVSVKSGDPDYIFISLTVIVLQERDLKI
jgi:hypothetical protein